MVDGTQTAALLPAAARARLEPGRRYRWFVCALGPTGTSIGISAARVVFVPE